MTTKKKKRLGSQSGPAAILKPPPAFHVMVQPKGAVCNLACDYCYFLSKEKLYPNGSFRMSEELLELYTRQLIESQQVPETTFAWQGGEPMLMGLDFFKQAIKLQKQYRPPGMRIFNTLQTNGTLLDDQWCAFFKGNDFLVGLSLDGPRHLHDIYRKDKKGNPVFDGVINGLHKLKEHKVDVNILTTINAANAQHALEVYRFLRDEVGVQFIQFIPIVERKNETGYQEGKQVTDRSVQAAQFGQFLIEVFDEWVKRDVGKIYIQHFDVALAAWLGEQPGLCIFSETCGTAFALEHNGDLYSCDHFVEPKFRLGNINKTPLEKLAASPRQHRFGKDKRAQLPQCCWQCDVRFICNGGCPKNRFKTAGLNYLCAGYQAFFRHIDQPMRRMAQLIGQQRPPADIMSETR